MGLISGLLTLPLAPVRGTVLVAQAIDREARRQANDRSAVQAALEDLDAERDRGGLSADEVEVAQDALLERLIAMRGLAPPDGDDRT